MLKEITFRDYKRLQEENEVETVLVLNPGFFTADQVLTVAILTKIDKIQYFYYGRVAYQPEIDFNPVACFNQYADDYLKDVLYYKAPALVKFAPEIQSRFKSWLHHLKIHAELEGVSSLGAGLSLYRILEQFNNKDDDSVYQASRFLSAVKLTERLLQETLNHIVNFFVDQLELEEAFKQAHKTGCLSLGKSYPAIQKALTQEKQRCLEHQEDFKPRALMVANKLQGTWQVAPINPDGVINHALTRVYRIKRAALNKVAEFVERTD